MAGSKENRTMRKSIIDPATTHPEQRSEQEWLDLEQVAKVEVTSEDANFPIESAQLRQKDRAGARTARVSRSSASSSTSPDRVAGLDSSLRSRKLSEPRNSLFDGRPSQADHLERLFASNGASVRMARRARSKIIRSIWIMSSPWSWSLSLTSRLKKH
jgi:hypothetical protein